VKGATCCLDGDKGGKICLDLTNVSAQDLAEKLSKAIGAEVRVQGMSFQQCSLKLCAPTAEAAVVAAAEAAHGRWRPAFIFAPGPSTPQLVAAGRPLTLTFRNTPAATAAFLAAAQAGAIVIADQPLKGQVTFSGKNVASSAVLDAIATAAGCSWKQGYMLQIGPETVAMRREDTSSGVGTGSSLRTRTASPLSHLHHDGAGAASIAPAPGMLVKDPEAEAARLEQEAMRRQQLGEWAGVFTQESPKAIKRAARDLRIRVETVIQKLESYPPQNRHLGAAMWHARYERMLEDFKSLTPDQQKIVQPVLDTMKYFASP
jgi:hypothetical protein